MANPVSTANHIVNLTRGKHAVKGGDSAGKAYMGQSSGGGESNPDWEKHKGDAYSTAKAIVLLSALNSSAGTAEAILRFLGRPDQQNLSGKWRSKTDPTLKGIHSASNLANHLRDKRHTLGNRLDELGATRPQKAIGGLASPL